MRELEILLKNFDSAQLDLVTAICLKVAHTKAESWTGEINFKVNFNQGGISGGRVLQDEVIRFPKKSRSIRSSRG